MLGCWANLLKNPMVSCGSSSLEPQWKIQIRLKPPTCGYKHLSLMVRPPFISVEPIILDLQGSLSVMVDFQGVSVRQINSVKSKMIPVYPIARLSISLYPNLMVGSTKSPVHHNPYHGLDNHQNKSKPISSWVPFAPFLRLTSPIFQTTKNRVFLSTPMPSSIITITWQPTP